MRTLKSQRGFTLLELLVASSVGLLVILMMTSLFKTGMDATFTVSQRAEVQQNLRAAVQLMTKDISLAGAGLPSGGLQLSSGGVSRYGCNQAGTCYVPNGTYPNAANGTANYMYAIEPGFKNGVESNAGIAAAPGQVNSSITTVYCDYNFALTNFSFGINAGGTSANVGVIASPTTGVPTNVLAPGGLNIGDLLMFTVATPGTGASGSSTGDSLVQNAAVVAEITGDSGTVGTQTGCTKGTCAWVLNFAANDALNFNFTTGTNNLAAIATAAAGANAQTSVCRLEVVSYFIEVPTSTTTVQTPRLMRQVNGLNAVPVADNIINLQFTYDIIDSTNGTVVANQQDPIGTGESPSLIQKVNLWVMGSSLTKGANKSQSLFLATSVSTSDMSFCNSYSYTTTACQ